MTGPILPPAGPTPPVTPGVGGGAAPPPDNPVDTISSGDLPGISGTIFDSGELSILLYALRQLEPVRDLEELAAQIIRDDANLNVFFRRAQIGVVGNFTQYEGEISAARQEADQINRSAISSALNDLQAAATAVNDAAAFVNAGIQSATNPPINYNNGNAIIQAVIDTTPPSGTPAQYAAAVAAYNTYVDNYNAFGGGISTLLQGEIDAYNLAVTDYIAAFDAVQVEVDAKNVIIAQRNIDKEANGEVLLIAQPPLDPSFARDLFPAVGTAPPAEIPFGLPFLSPTPPPSAAFDTFVNDFFPLPTLAPIDDIPAIPEVFEFANSFFTYIQQLSVFAGFVNVNSAYLAALLDRESNGIVTEIILHLQRGDLSPAAERENITQAATELRNASGGSIAGIVLGLDNSRLNAILSQGVLAESINSVFERAGSVEGQELTSRTVDALGILLVKAGVASAVTGTTLALSLRARTTGRDFVNGLAISLGFSGQLTNVANAENLRNLLGDVVDSAPLRPTDKDALLNQLSQTSAVSLLSLNIAQLSQAIGAPGLLLQPLALQIALATPGSTSDVSALASLVTGKLAGDQINQLRDQLTGAFSNALSAEGLSDEIISQFAGLFAESLLAGNALAIGDIPGLSPQQVAALDSRLATAGAVGVITAGIVQDAANYSENATLRENTRRAFIDTIAAQGLAPELADEALAILETSSSILEAYTSLQARIRDERAAEALIFNAVTENLRDRIQREFDIRVSSGPQVQFLVDQIIFQLQKATDQIGNSLRELNAIGAESALRAIPKQLISSLEEAQNPDIALDGAKRVAREFSEVAQDLTVSPTVQQVKKQQTEFNV